MSKTWHLRKRCPLRLCPQTNRRRFYQTTGAYTHRDDQPLPSQPTTNDFSLKRDEILRHRRMDKYGASFRRSRPTRVNGTDKVKEKLPSHLLEVYTSMMLALHKRDWQHAVHTLQTEIENDATANDVVLFTVAIRACSVSGKFAEAVKLYDQMHDVAGIAPDAVTLIAMLKGCAIIRDWRQSQWWYHKIMRDGQLSLSSLSTIEQQSIHSLRISSADRYSWEHAWHLFESLPAADKDLILHNAMLEVLARSRRYEHCEQLFVDISNDPRLRTQMDVYTFASMIRACVAGGHIQRALNCMTQMQSRPFCNIKPNAPIITDILRTLQNYNGEENAFVLAQKLWLQVVGVNALQQRPLITPDAVLFGAMLDVCCTHGQFDYAMKLFREMVTVYKIRPSVIVFNNLLKCAVHAQQSMQYLHNLVRDLKNVYGVSADRVTYSILLNAMIQHTQRQLELQHETLQKHEKYVYIAELLTFWNDCMRCDLKDEVVYCTLINRLFHMNEKYFEGGQSRNIIHQQMMALYACGCDEKHLGHWSTSPSTYVKQLQTEIREMEMDVNQTNNYWVLEMHGWPVGVACIAIEYFFEYELENVFRQIAAVYDGNVECKHLLIAVGKGKHSQGNNMILQPRALQYIQQRIGIKKVQYLPQSACLFVDRNDIKTFLHSKFQN